MRFHPKLIKFVDGEPYINGAGILLLSADALHGNVPVKPDARQRAQSTIDALLAAARTGGFTQSEVLETLLSKDREAERTVDLAIIAVDCIGGPEAFANALARAGFDPEGQ
ncbi:hypothetical protein BZM27_47970 [Paraburkholderia steynii]|uniref:Uncharacterized protein n=1 Tax=Paraburkholderia steynii TaxID=1245441 RepID=A0A4R0X7N8_9BURK|nr:hypothetical protein BZM27_47970 [Paraburkholderia steynii]